MPTPTTTVSNSGQSNSIADLQAQAKALQRTLVDSVASGQIPGVVTQANTAGAAGRVANSPQIVSSNSPLADKNKMDARMQAGSALTSDASTHNSLTQAQTDYQNLQFQHQNAYLADQDSARNALSLKFDTSIANSNAQYGALLHDLNVNMNNDVSSATAQAASLNPYSDSAGAMTARNFNSAIYNKYQEHATRLELQARQAEDSLRAGQFEAYTNLSNSMKQSNRDFQSNMSKFTLDSQQQNQQNRQWQQTYNLNSSQAFEGNFQNFVDRFAADPAFKKDIGNYFQTGEISPALEPLIERGRKIGMTTSESLSVAQSKSINQLKMEQDQSQFQSKMQVEWYNAQSLREKADTMRDRYGNPYGTTDGTTGGGQISANPVVKTALDQALASKGVSQNKLNEVRNIADTQGMKGLGVWAYNNMLSNNQQTKYDANSVSSGILDNALDKLNTTSTSFGPYKAIAESAKPWATMKRDNEYSAIRAQIENAQSGVRKDKYGGTLTTNEAASADKFLITDADSLDTIKTKLQNFSGVSKYINAKLTGQVLGVADTVKLSDYLNSNNSQNSSVKTPNFGIGTAPGVSPVSDAAIKNFWNTPDGQELMN